MYTVMAKGLYKGEYVQQSYRIDCVQRIVQPQDNFNDFLHEATNPDLEFIVSNTTEAGIAFSEADASISTLAATFPGKLTQLLHHRFESRLNNALVVIPCELLEENGALLKRCVLHYAAHWKLSSDFTAWIESSVTFCNTLVDRIVPGAPKGNIEESWKAIGYKDELIVEAEWFHLLVIEAPAWVEEKLPFKKAGINVVFSNDLDAYRNRKVKILNGAHSAMACVGYLAGIETVREAMEHEVIGGYIRKLTFNEIVPYTKGDRAELRNYTEEVFARFLNPAIKHALLSITLNSFAKFKVRLLPTLQAFANDKNAVPPRLAYAFAALFFLYRGLKSGKEIQLNDNAAIIDAVKKAWQQASFTPEGMRVLCAELLSKTEWWGTDLTQVPGLVQQTGNYLYAIDQHGIVQSLREQNTVHP